MTKSVVLDLVNNRYPVPFLGHWQPSEYDMKYKYNTPRKAKKIEVDREKEDAKLKSIFDRESLKRESVINTIDEISTFPDKVADLFLSTFKMTIDDLVRRHEACLNAKKAISDEFGDIGLDVLRNAKYKMVKRQYESSWTGSRGRYVERKVMLTKDEWQKFANEYKTNFHKVSEDKYEYDYPAKGIKDPEKLMKLGIEYWDAKDNDDISSDGDNAYVFAIQRMSDTLRRILEEIKVAFNGKRPDSCETDANWGMKGNFEGILKCGEERVSFKSFGAGGFNIQRFHFRFKVTKLKH